MAKTKTKKHNRASRELSQDKKNEIMGLAFLALTLLLFIAFISYDPNDLPFYTSYPNQQIKNLIGIIGAYVAGALFFLIGATSFVMPFLTLSWSLSKFSAKKPQKLYVKTIGTIVLIASVSSLFSLIFVGEPVNSFKGGGLIGMFVSGYLVRYFGYTGTYIILFALIGLSLLIATEFFILPIATSCAVFVAKFFIFLYRNVISRLFMQRRARPVIISSSHAQLRQKSAQPKFTASSTTS